MPPDALLAAGMANPVAAGFVFCPAGSWRDGGECWGAAIHCVGRCSVTPRLPSSRCSPRSGVSTQGRKVRGRAVKPACPPFLGAAGMFSRKPSARWNLTLSSRGPVGPRGDMVGIAAGPGRQGGRDRRAGRLPPRLSPLGVRLPTCLCLGVGPGLARVQGAEPSTQNRRGGRTRLRDCRRLARACTPSSPTPVV